MHYLLTGYIDISIRMSQKLIYNLSSLFVARQHKRSKLIALNRHSIKLANFYWLLLQPMVACRVEYKRNKNSNL